VRERFSGGVGIHSNRLPQGTIGLQNVVARSGLAGRNGRPRLLQTENSQRKTERLKKIHVKLTRENYGLRTVIARSGLAGQNDR
jgi:hypothetical protein